MSYVIDTMLGTGIAAPAACRRFTVDLAVHWYPQGATPGTPCFCGETTMNTDDHEDVA